MDFLSHLWLPILVSAAAVWIASSLAWMVIGHHKHTWKEIPNEDEFIATIKRFRIAPGSCGFPEFRKCEGLSKEEKLAKWEEMQKHPIGVLRVWGPLSMGRNWVLSLVVNLVASTLIGYHGWSALRHGGSDGAPTASFAKVMQVLGTVGILAYCFASLQNDIWFQRSRREVVTGLIDGVVLGLITGAVFRLLWPD